MTLLRRSCSTQCPAAAATALATALAMALAMSLAMGLAAALAALSLLTSGPASAAETPPGVWPLEPQPEVVHGFDPPDVRWQSGHRGVDLAGRVGQPVRAALAGTVTFAGRIAGRGVVVVDHGATRTTYQPVTASVSRGEVVAQGQVLGTLAWYGTHCSPAACLHWGLVAGSTYLDPLSLVGGPRPVRLLPLDGIAPIGYSGAEPVVSSVVTASRDGLRGVALAAVAGASVRTVARSPSREHQLQPHDAHLAVRVLLDEDQLTPGP